MSERIEITMNANTFLMIGLNTIIDHENTENLWHERVFQFYIRLEQFSDKSPDNDAPDRQLKMKTDVNYEGMDFIQFYIFTKDGDSTLKADRERMFEIYKDQCQTKQHQRLSCDDWIELVRKHKLIRKKYVLNVNMKFREEQCKNMFGFVTKERPSFTESSVQTDNSCLNIQVQTKKENSPVKSETD